MEKTIIRQPSIPEIRASQPHAKDSFMICDLGGLCEVVTDERLREYAGFKKMRDGAPELTATAEKFMARFEHDVFLGRGFSIVDDVCGAMPNVPAFISGNPYNMRYRKRVRSNRAPLSIFFELTGSAGTMVTRAERGAAMLALVRLLANTRPVDLWTLTTYGRHGVMNMVACRVDSAPLDVARAAAQLCDMDVLGMITHVNNDLLGGGNWSYGVPELERKWSGEALRRVICPANELLFIPASYIADAHNQPEQWVRDMLKKYGMGAVDQDETDAA